MGKCKICGLPTHQKRYCSEDCRRVAFPQRYISPQDLTSEGLDILLGSILGDGGFHLPRNNPRYREGHSIDQEDYLRWKRDNLKTLGVELNDPKPNKSYKGSKDSIRLTSKVLPGFRHWYDQVYCDGVKIIPRELMKSLGPLGLAVWVMDDGMYQLRNTRGGQIRLATYCFSYEDHLFLVKYFPEHFGIKVNLRFRPEKGKKGLYYLAFTKAETAKLVEIIRPHIHPTLLYKIGIGRKPVKG